MTLMYFGGPRNEHNCSLILKSVRRTESIERVLCVSPSEDEAAQKTNNTHSMSIVIFESAKEETDIPEG